MLFFSSFLDRWGGEGASCGDLMNELLVRWQRTKASKRRKASRESKQGKQTGERARQTAPSRSEGQKRVAFCTAERNRFAKGMRCPRPSVRTIPVLQGVLVVFLLTAQATRTKSLQQVEPYKVLQVLQIPIILQQAIYHAAVELLADFSAIFLCARTKRKPHKAKGTSTAIIETSHSGAHQMK